MVEMEVEVARSVQEVRGGGLPKRVMQAGAVGGKGEGVGNSSQ
jgi:hypothetical protein